MKKQTNARRIVGIYWQYSKPYKSQISLIYFFMVVAQLIEDFAQPLIVSFILTNVASGHIDRLRHTNLFWLVSGVILTEMVGHIIWNKVVIPVFWRTQDSVMRDLNMAAFDHLQTMSARFFGDRFAGSLVSQVNKFVASYERLTDALTWNVFKLLVSVVATTIILLPKAPVLSLAILVISAIYIPLVWKFRKRQLPYNTAWAAAETDRTGQLADTISNVLAVKSFSGEQIEQKRMQVRVNRVHARSMDTMKMTLRNEFYTGTVQRSINISVIIISLLLAVNGKTQVGIIYLALTFTLAIMRRLWDLNNTFRTFTRVFGDAHDMAEIMNIEPEVKDIENPEKLNVDHANLTLQNIVFSHEADKKPLFDGLNLSVNAGEKIGLVGHSGSGKTTITKLLLRFMDIQSGSIQIDGQNIAKVAQQDLRIYIAYVPQEPLLFHRSLSDNISYGKPGASQKEIERVSKLAHAHEFVKELPLGYETLVGERGVKLSGGQRQRIAIARAMIKDAPILVLDEATSALDSESEVLIQDALWKLMEGRTALVIAHRLSTIQKMDRIIVMDDGKIIEQGSHNELIKLKGKYAELWAHQSGGFLKD